MVQCLREKAYGCCAVGCPGQLSLNKAVLFRYEEALMNIDRSKNRYLNSLVAALLVGLTIAFGCVGTAFALDCSPPGIAKDTVECEHSWAGENLPECLQVGALHELSLWEGRRVPERNCDYSAALINNCAVAYVVEFECIATKDCPESRVLEIGEDVNVDFGFDTYSTAKGEDGRVKVSFIPVDESGREIADDLDGDDEVISGVFTGSHSGEATLQDSSHCDEGFFCQVASMRRPVGGFGSVLVMMLGLVGIVWRRRWAV